MNSAKRIRYYNKDINKKVVLPKDLLEKVNSGTYTREQAIAQDKERRTKPAQPSKQLRREPEDYNPPEGNYLPKGSSDKFRSLQNQVDMLKKELYGSKDETFEKVWQNYNDTTQPNFKEKEDKLLQDHFGTRGLKILKNMVFNKLLDKTITHTEFVKYQNSPANVKKQYLINVLMDIPFLAGLLTKAAPFLASKAYDYLTPRVKQWGMDLARAGLNKLQDTEWGRTLLEKPEVQRARQAFNLDAEEVGDPQLDIPEVYNGPTSGLISKQIKRVIKPSDVSLRSLQSAYWPENEAFRFSLPNDNNYTAVLQASNYVSVPITNNLGNLFMSIVPTQIAYTQFAWAFNAAGANILSPGTSSVYAGPIYSNQANFASFRVSGMSVYIMNSIAPLNRAGTISIAITEKNRPYTTPPTFGSMNMSMAFAQASYQGDSYSALYVPDEETEWSLIPMSAPFQSVDSEILIAVEGAPVGVTPFKLLISYTLEFMPSDLARPLVTVGRSEVAPSTLQASQLMLKYYNSILLATPNERGAFFRRLLMNYGDFIDIEQLSVELSNYFMPQASERVNMQGDSIGPAIANNSSSLARIAPNTMHTPLRSKRPATPNQDSVNDKKFGNNESDLSESDEVLKPIRDQPTTFYSVISQIQTQSAGIGLDTKSAIDYLTVMDQKWATRIDYSLVNGLFNPLTTVLTPSNWFITIHELAVSWTQQDNIVSFTAKDIPGGGYEITLHPRSSNEIIIAGYPVVTVKDAKSIAKNKTHN